MILMGLGITLIRTMDILRGKFREQGNLFHWKNDGGDLMWPHLLAEYLTALVLVMGGIGLFRPFQGSLLLSMAALGALFYTSLNSLGWVLVRKERCAYGTSMMAGILGSVICFVVLLR